MAVRAVDHISINTKDMAASLRFYSEVLGFRRGETVAFDGFSITYFEIPGGGRLELFDYGGKNPAAVRQDSEVGLRHLAFAVEDVDEEEKRLRSAGVAITLSATDLPSLGARVLLFLDPNAVTLEFCQELTGR